MLRTDPRESGLDAGTKLLGAFAQRTLASRHVDMFTQSEMHNPALTLCLSLFLSFFQRT